MNRYIGLVAAGAFLSVGFASTADLSISPVKVSLSKRNPASQVELGNAGDASALMQSQVLRWTRQNCVDHVEPTQELAISPPIFALQGKSKQVVRVLLVGADSAEQESTMRLVLTQVGDTTAEDGAVVTRLAISLPVFVLPGVPVKPKLEWTLVRAGALLRITAHNAGNAHTRLRALKLTGRHGETLSEESHTDYMLAGDSCTWTLPAERSSPVTRLIAVTEDGEIALEVPTP